jgi:hypothetical protein
LKDINKCRRLVDKFENKKIYFLGKVLNIYEINKREILEEANHI